MKELPKEICFACSKPILDNDLNFQYVRTEANGFVVSHYDENNNPVAKLGKDGKPIVTTHDVPCKKDDEGARLLKEAPTHSLRFKVVNNILFVAYAVAINNDVKKLYDTYSCKKGREITAKRIEAIEANWHEVGTTADELNEVGNFLPRVVMETWEHYLQLALYRLNIHGRVALMVKGDARDNDYHQIEFEACDETCPSCGEAKRVDLGVSDKEDDKLVEEFVEEFNDDDIEDSEHYI